MVPLGLKKFWLVNVFFWLIHQSLISWFYYLIEYSGVWSVINHVTTYQYWETLYFHFTVSCRFYFNTIWQWGSFYIKSSRRKVKLWKYYQTFLATYLECLSGWIYFSQYYFGFLLLYVQKVCTLTHSPCQMIPYNVVITECFWRKLLKLNQIYLHSL